MDNTEIIKEMHRLLSTIIEDGEVTTGTYDDIECYLEEIKQDLINKRIIRE